MEFNRSYTLRQMLRQSPSGTSYIVDNITGHCHRPPHEAMGGLAGRLPMPTTPSSARSDVGCDARSPKGGTLPHPVSSEDRRSGFVGHAKTRVNTAKTCDPLCSQHLAPAYRHVDDRDINRRARRKAKQCDDADLIGARRMAEDSRRNLLMWSGPKNQKELEATTRAEMKRTVNITGSPRNPDRRREPGDPRPEKPVRAPKYDPREARRRPSPVSRRSAAGKKATAPEP